MPLQLMYGVTLTVEAAFSAATGTYALWDNAAWDTGTWGPDVAWTDISQWVRGVSTNRRFGRDVGAWESGTATIVLDNRDGRFSADNMAGPYVTAGVTQLRPWRPVRVTAAYAGVSYPVYRGYTIDMPEQWPGQGVDATVTLSCVDELAKLANFDGLQQAAQGDGELSGARIHRVLSNAGHTGARNIDPGRVSMQPTDLSQNAVTELKLVADSEGGALHIGADGTVVFADQYDLLENPRSNTTQATFGDGAGTESLTYADAAMAYNANLVKTIVAWSRAGGTAQVASDNTARALYGDLRDTSNTNLVCETDSQVLGLAQFQLARVKDPERRIASMTVLPRNNPSALFPQVLGRKVRDRVHVNRYPAGGYTISRDVFISGVAHTITMDNWVTGWEFASATPYNAFLTSLWDVGAWDTAVFFY